MPHYKQKWKHISQVNIAFMLIDYEALPAVAVGALSLERAIRNV